jgi:hypothetical protein
MNVSAIILAARQRAQSQGSSYVRLEHLSEEQIEELAIETLAYLRERDGAAASELIPGWSRVAASQAGVLGAWLEKEDLSKDERRRIRPLRTAIYDLLEERGLVFKTPGQGASVHVSPNDESAFTEPPKVEPSPPKSHPRSRNGRPPFAAGLRLRFKQGGESSQRRSDLMSLSMPLITGPW